VKHFTKTIGLVLLVCLCCLPAGCAEDRYQETIAARPVLDAAAITSGQPTDYDAVLASYQNVGDLHIITYNGSFDAMVEGQHRQLLELYRAFPEGLERRTGCSMFRYGASPGGLVGRNFDNKYSELLVGYFYPPDGYASLGLVALMHLGYNEDKPFDPDNVSNRRSLFMAPPLTIEGLNEKGVTVTLASLDKREVWQDPERESRYLIHLVREILDHAANLDEAVAIAAKYNVFDNGLEVISHHIFVADPEGSVVLEWRNGFMEVVRDPGDWQVVTNSPLVGVEDERRRKGCPRYDSLAGSMSRAAGAMDWRQGMDALAATAQRNRRYNLEGQDMLVSTQWSAVFHLEQMAAYVCLSGDYSKVYRLEFPPRPVAE
jgi:choloylglycine hydrolase